MSKVTIYHNPKCGTSRNTLALIREKGIEPEVIEYLKQMPSRAALRKMIKAADLSVRGAMREKETIFAELGLGAADVTDEQLIDAIEAHPILLNRPFVVAPGGTRLCRPMERVLEILEK